MKIFIVGLGLMGASYAQALSEKHDVYGYDINPEVNLKAVTDGIIISSDILEIVTSDLVILALYPKENVSFIKTHQSLFKDQVLTDLSGTKEWMITEIEKLLPQSIDYISHHPMAGKETSGYASKNKEMFQNANFIIIPTSLTKEQGYRYLNEIYKDLSFGKKLIISAKEHDELIAFTSQLTHVIAVSLVNSDTHKHTKEATGDSYRDLTRIAKINEVMWTELFIENKEKLINEMDKVIKELNTMKELIKKEDKTSIQEKLILSTQRRKELDRN